MGRKRISGVYIITNNLTNQHYVGQSLCVLDRLWRHKKDLQLNKHDNEHLQFSYNKYGNDAFSFDLLIEAEEACLFSEEHFWCNMLNTHDRKLGFNILPTNPFSWGKPSKESQEKATRAIRNKTPEHISKIQKSKWETGSISRSSDKIRQLDLQGNEIAIYDSIREAARITGECRPHIARICKGVTKNPSKFKWEYIKKGILNKHHDSITDTSNNN